MCQRRSAFVPSVDRALDVIELMAASDRDLSLSEIMDRVNVPRQSLIRILNTLCDRGVVSRTERRGFYRLGMRLLYLGDRLKDKINLRIIALPFMQELARETRKTIELSTLNRDQLILIEQIEGTEGVRLYSRVGSVYPYFHAVGAGKVYLAHMELKKRRHVLDETGLPAVTEHTQTDIDQLEVELSKVRDRGYAFENQELRKGVRKVAAPIYDFRNQVAGCLGIAATIFSFSMEDRGALGRMVMAKANRISHRLGKE